MNIKIILYIIVMGLIAALISYLYIQQFMIKADTRCCKTDIKHSHKYITLEELKARPPNNMWDMWGLPNERSKK